MLALLLLLSSEDQEFKQASSCPGSGYPAPAGLSQQAVCRQPQVFPRCHGNLCEGRILMLAGQAFQPPPSEGDPTGHCLVLCHRKACLKLDQGHGGDGQPCSQNQGEEVLGRAPERPWVSGDCLAGLRSSSCPWPASPWPPAPLTNPCPQRGQPGRQPSVTTNNTGSGTLI